MLLGQFHIVGVLRRVRIVARQQDRHRASGLRRACKDDIHRRVIVKGVGDRLAHILIVQRRILIVHAQEEELHIGIFFHHNPICLLQLFERLHGVPLLDEVHLPFLEHQLLGRQLANDQEGGLSHLARFPATPIIVELAEDSLGARFINVHIIGPRTSVLLIEEGLAIVAKLPVVAVLLVLHQQIFVDHEELHQGGQEGSIGLIQVESHSVVVDHLDIPHVQNILPQPGETFTKGQHAIHAEGHVLSRELRAIVELDAFLQLEGIGQTIIGDLPRLGQMGLGCASLGRPHQGLVDVHHVEALGLIHVNGRVQSNSGLLGGVSDGYLFRFFSRGCLLLGGLCRGLSFSRLGWCLGRCRRGRHNTLGRHQGENQQQPQDAQGSRAAYHVPFLLLWILSNKPPTSLRNRVFRKNPVSWLLDVFSPGIPPF